MKTFVLSCGHRNVFPSEKILEKLSSTPQLEDYLSFIQDVANKDELSNSEVSAAVACFGAFSAKSDVKLVRLNELIDVQGNGNSQYPKFLEEIIYDASAIIVASPLHFGNPSSYLMRLLHDLTKINNSPFENKVIGQTVVGARRNGGQEAGNIFGLFEYSQLGAAVVGDGPPFSQSGGILESRNPKTALQDKEGIQSGLNLGSRVVRASVILDNQNYHPNGNVAIITDTDGAYECAQKFILPILERSENMRCRVINLSKYRIERCIGCNECPVNTDSYYKCIINDEMFELEKEVIDADGFIVCLEADNNLWSSYNWQTFVERSRYLRRGDYKFANKPIMSVQYCSSENVMPFHIRVLSPAFKHDMIFVGPSLTLTKNSQTTNETTASSLAKFTELLLRAKSGRQSVPYYSGYREEAKRFV